jgi:uncharacterized DUF497 family protein
LILKHPGSSIKHRVSFSLINIQSYVLIIETFTVLRALKVFYFELDLYTFYVYIYFMEYQWDIQKATLNLRKHGIDFADAVGVFEDVLALTIKEQNIEGEQRVVTLGMDFLNRIIVIVYSYRNEDIRLISARKATKSERQTYERKRRI